MTFTASLKKKKKRVEGWTVKRSSLELNALSVSKNLYADAVHLGAKFLYTECFCLEEENLYKC